MVIVNDLVRFREGNRPRSASPLASQTNQFVGGVVLRSATGASHPDCQDENLVSYLLVDFSEIARRLASVGELKLIRLPALQTATGSLHVRR